MANSTISLTVIATITQDGVINECNYQKLFKLSDYNFYQFRLTINNEKNGIYAVGEKKNHNLTDLDYVFAEDFNEITEKIRTLKKQNI